MDRKEIGVRVERNSDPPRTIKVDRLQGGASLDSPRTVSVSIVTHEPREWTEEEIQKMQVDSRILEVLAAPTDFDGDPPEDWPAMLREELELQARLKGPASSSMWGDFPNLKELFVQEVVDGIHRPLIAKIAVLFHTLRARLAEGSIERQLTDRLSDLTCDLRVFQVESALKVASRIDAALPSSTESFVSDIIAGLAAESDQDAN